MDIKSELKRLIDNPLTPNAAEWAMDAEDLLTELKMLSEDAQKHISMDKLSRRIKSYKGETDEV